MNLNLSNFSHIIRTSLFVLAAVFVLGYAVLRSVPYARGPIVTIYEPINGSTVATTTIEIVGKAERVNAITINGNNISIDEKGNFKETLIIFKGINLITVEATDQFKRSEKAQLTILGTI